MSHSLSLRLSATGDLLKRYAAVFRHAWRERKALDPKPRLPHEAQLLPASLELQETPVSPAPRNGSSTTPRWSGCSTWAPTPPSTWGGRSIGRRDVNRSRRRADRRAVIRSTAGNERRNRSGVAVLA